MLLLSVCVGLFVLLACVYVHSTRVASLCVLAAQSLVENLASLVGGLRWKGPFQEKELTSRETATRDVVVTESQKDISWCLFDGQTFEETKLECHGSLLGVVATAEPLEPQSTVYLIYEGGAWC